MPTTRPRTRHLPSSAAPVHGATTATEAWTQARRPHPRRYHESMPASTPDPRDSFAGFHPDVLPFFDELAANNERAFWLENKERYERHVRAPMEALAAALEGAFGEPHFYRPYRDLRFSKDKRPYKLHVAVSFGGRGPSAIGGRYVHLDRSGLFVGGGAYQLDAATVARYRKAVAEPRNGEAFAAMVADLQSKGYAIEGERLTRAPRDYPADHPRIDLLKHKGIYASKQYAPAAWFYTPELLDRVARVFGDTEAMVTWLRHNLA